MVTPYAEWLSFVQSGRDKYFFILFSILSIYEGEIVRYPTIWLRMAAGSAALLLFQAGLLKIFTKCSLLMWHCYTFVGCLYWMAPRLCNPLYQPSCLRGDNTRLFNYISNMARLPRCVLIHTILLIVKFCVYLCKDLIGSHKLGKRKLPSLVILTN